MDSSRAPSNDLRTVPLPTPGEPKALAHDGSASKGPRRRIRLCLHKSPESAVTAGAATKRRRYRTARSPRSSVDELLAQDGPVLQHWKPLRWRCVLGGPTASVKRHRLLIDAGWRGTAKRWVERDEIGHARDGQRTRGFVRWAWAGLSTLCLLLICRCRPHAIGG